MQTFKVGFWENARVTEEPVAEFIVSSASEGEAIEQATTLFSERYPEKRLVDHDVHSTPA